MFAVSTALPFQSQLTLLVFLSLLLLVLLQPVLPVLEPKSQLPVLLTLPQLALLSPLLLLDALPTLPKASASTALVNLLLPRPLILALIGQRTIWDVGTLFALNAIHGLTIG